MMSTSKNWNTDIVPGQLNAFNLYNTNYIVQDIDRDVDENGESVGMIERFIQMRKKEGRPVFEATTTDGSKHKRSVHIWYRIEGRTTQCKFAWGEFLGNMKSHALFLKTNKYPKNFRVSDMGKVPFISEEKLVDDLKRYKMFNPIK